MTSILELYGGHDNTLFGADSRSVVRRLEYLELFSVLLRLDIAEDVRGIAWLATRRHR